MAQIKDLKSQTFGALVVLEFAGIINSHARWLCVCGCGNEHVVLGLNLLNGNTKSCGKCSLYTPGAKRRKHLSYSGVHVRLARDVGPAKSFICVDCGEPAAHWSWDHTGTPMYDHIGSPYSTDQSKYVPRCAKDHKIYDNAHKVAA